MSQFSFRRPGFVHGVRFGCFCRLRGDRLWGLDRVRSRHLGRLRHLRSGRLRHSARVRSGRLGLHVRMWIGFVLGVHLGIVGVMR